MHSDSSLTNGFHDEGIQSSKPALPTGKQGLRRAQSFLELPNTLSHKDMVGLRRSMSLDDELVRRSTPLLHLMEHTATEPCGDSVHAGNFDKSNARRRWKRALFLMRPKKLANGSLTVGL
jgi:hypothetical protein